ncbi:MAG: hypothetical protein CL840_20180 [Crocinitomicaceae bacterium]|nr:hypothetical protein [Crocinitomicaceae bacterium]|tara:strand:+ start:11749 stop:13026 length:1278 start_codon:yes stop_codon:yes gene_type:complete
MAKRVIYIAAIIIALFNLKVQAGSVTTETFKIIGPANGACAGTDITLTASGKGRYEYVWFPRSAFANNTLKTVSTHIRKTTEYSVIRVNLYTHKADTAYITVKIEEGRVDILGETYICSGDSAHLVLPPAYSYPVWNTGTSSQGIWVTKPGVYRVEATGDCKFVKGNIYVKAVSKPLAVISTFEPLEICEGDEVHLSAFGNPDRFTWSTGDDKKDITVSSSQEVELTVINECGISKDVKEIKVQEVEASFIPSKLNENVPFTLDLVNESKGNATNQWYINGEPFSEDKHASILIEEEGDYEITLERTTSIGCSNKMKYSTITALPPVQPVIPQDKLIIFPNCFTPNGDGLNDHFEFQSNYIHNIKFIVFDRWGHEVYECAGGSTSWDGTIMDGTLAPAGQYVVKFEYLNLEGIHESRIAGINILR